MRKSKQAPRNRKYAILYIIIIKVCTNTFILFVFIGIARLANGKSPPPQLEKFKTYAIRGGGIRYHFFCGRKKVQIYVVLVIFQKSVVDLVLYISRVQKVYTCNYFVWGPIITQSGWLWVDSPPTSLQMHLSQDQPISHNELDLSYNNSPQLILSFW